MTSSWRRELCWGICSIEEINSVRELNPVDCIEEIISDGDWKFIGCTEEVSTIFYGNDQTSLSSRGPIEEDDHVKLSIRDMEVNYWKMPQFLSEGILDLLGNICWGCACEDSSVEIVPWRFLYGDL